MAAPRPPADALDREWSAGYRARIHRAPAHVRVMLAELRNRPGVCTSELGELVGGQPNASRLLRRLEGLGLARSEELTRGAAGGRPYRLWWLTRTGGRLAGLDGKP